MIKIIIEIAIAAALIVGLFNEDKIADWEENLFAKVKARFKK